jgi:YidC/Oxa1 family membrane protein insertase
LAILIYWVINNAWTLAQQHVVYGMVAGQDELATLRAQQHRIALAPKPGSRPRHKPAKKSAATQTADEVCATQL